MPTDTVKFERRGAVAVITLNRSEQANSLDLPMAKAFFAAAAECGAPSVRAVVLTGAGREGTAAFLGKRPPVFVPSSLET